MLVASLMVTGLVAVALQEEATQPVDDSYSPAAEAQVDEIGLPYPDKQPSPAENPHSRARSRSSQIFSGSDRGSQHG